MKTKIKIVLAILLSLMVVSSLSASDRYGKQKAVYHINYDNPKIQAGGLRNIQNHINAVGKENLSIKVVLHGKGLTLVLKPDAVKSTKLKVGNATKKIQEKIANLKKQGIEFLVCANTLKSKNIDFKTHLYDVKKSDIVPSGVAEITYLQMAGFAYIKP